MRIVLVNQYYSEKMGYADNGLAKALASLGHDVHIVTSNAQPYATAPDYATTYQPFLGPARGPAGTTQVDGVHVHRLVEEEVRGRWRLRGLTRTMLRLQPHAVQTFSSWSLTTTQLALARPLLRCVLTSSCHIHASVFPDAQADLGPRARLRWTMYRATAGSVISAAISRCYAISTDAADIATRFFGIAREKVVVAPLGVDTSLFFPEAPTGGEGAAALRRRVGLADDDVVCIYTGRFTRDKDPYALAGAIRKLRARGRKVSALFVGGGAAVDVGELSDPGAGLVRLDFVDFRELGAIYRAADIGVWPRQESTSQLDAAACGLPLILSDRVHTPERIDGNGVTYREGDVDALAAAIEGLMDMGADARRKMGMHGAKRIRERFAWTTIARERVDDFRAFRRRQSRLTRATER